MFELPHNGSHFTWQQVKGQNTSSQTSAVHKPRTSDVQTGFLKKAEEPEIKLPTSVGSKKKRESYRKTSTSTLLTMPKPLTVWITTN